MHDTQMPPSHRGVGYLAQNDRFFVSFKAGASWEADEDSTYDLQEVHDKSEDYVTEQLPTWRVPEGWRKLRTSGDLF